MKQVYLLTGVPGSGKTSVIKQIAAVYSSQATGFYTEEIRTDGTRNGFRLVALSGEQGILASTNFSSPYRVGKYSVDIDALERIGVPALLIDRPLVVVDEIGKMEMLSLQFRETILRVIRSGRPMLATVMLHHHAWSDVIKNLPEVNLMMLNRQNRESILSEIRDWLKEML